MVGGANSRLESNLVSARDAQRLQTNLVRTRTQGLHKDRDRIVFERLQWRYGLAVVHLRYRGSGCGYGINPLGGGHHLPHCRAARTYMGLGNRLLESTTEPCAQDSGGRISDPTGDLPVGVWESLVKAWVRDGLLQGWGCGV